MDILLDVDGVLRNIVDVLIRIYRRELDPTTTITHKDIKMFDVRPAMPLVEDPKQFFFIDHAAEVFGTALPYPGVIAAINEMYEDHDIHIVTNQFPGNESITLNWLWNWEIPYHSISFIKDKTRLSDAGDVLLDDKLKTLLDFRVVKGAIPVCHSQPWNSEWDGLRVGSLQEFNELLRWKHVLTAYKDYPVVTHQTL